MLIRDIRSTDIRLLALAEAARLLGEEI